MKPPMFKIPNVFTLNVFQGAGMLKLIILSMDNFDDGPCEVICRVPISTFSQGAIV